MPIVEPPRQSSDPLIATQPEWKLFQSLKKQGGGVSVLLIFTFALLIYSLYHYEKNIVYCNYYEIWLVAYTISLLLFRVIHHVSILRWQRAIEKRNDRKMRLYINLFVHCHKILIPVLFILISIGFGMVYISLRGKRQIATCLPSFAIALLEFLLLFAMAVLCMKVALMGNVLLQRFKLYDTYMHWEDAAYTSISANGRWIYGLRTIILSCPIVKACEIMPLENVECAICLESICEQHPVRNFPCEHMFHLHCIDKWLKNHSTCPLCVAKVRQSSDNIDVSEFRSRG